MKTSNKIYTCKRIKQAAIARLFCIVVFVTSFAAKQRKDVSAVRLFVRLFVCRHLHFSP